MDLQEVELEDKIKKNDMGGACRWIFKKWNWRIKSRRMTWVEHVDGSSRSGIGGEWIGLIWLRIGTGGGLL